VTLLAGIDLSTKRLDAALIPADPDDTTVPPVTFRRFDLPRMPTGCTAQYRSVERCRVLRDAMRELLQPVIWKTRSVGLSTGLGPVHEVSSVWVEEPFGPRNKATNALREVYGGILASIPLHIERAAIAPQEWRRVVLEAEHGHLDRAWQKEDSTDLADLYLHRHRQSRAGIDEHQAEALLIALAGRELTWRAVEGAA
jgi:hypothetical protein